MKLPKWLEKVEYLVDRSIPFMLILLTILIVIEFTHLAEEYHNIIVILDDFIIAFFIIDLLFKWNHATKTTSFLKVYWIDIIAVFPFYLIFRLYAITAEIIIVGEQSQKFMHEAALIRETKLLQQSRIVSKLAKQGRYFRIIPNFLRLLRIRWYVAHGHLQDISTQYQKEHRIKQ